MLGCEGQAVNAELLGGGAKISGLGSSLQERERRGTWSQNSIVKRQAGRIAANCKASRMWTSTDGSAITFSACCLLLLPASAERLVKLHKALELVATVLREGQLGAEERTLVVEDFEIGSDAAAVALE
jgi:hypothetical protein